MFSAFESSVQEPLVAGKKFLNRTVLGQDLPLVNGCQEPLFLGFESADLVQQV